MSDLAVTVRNVTKIYKLYDAPIARLKEALHPLRRKYHRNFSALDGVDFEVRRGECVGIIGLNGAGKSTLLQIIAGVLTPTSGHVEVNGRLAALLELGAGFNPEFTGVENVRLQCSIMGLGATETERLLPEITAFADIGEFVGHPVKTYSSGMYVRLAFAAAISVDPDVLIVDEALAVGDIRFQAKCLQRIRAFRERGKTLLFVSHDPGAVKALCSKAYLLDGGKVLDQGPPDRVFNYYNSLIAEKDARTAVAEASSRKGDLAQRSGSGRLRIERVRMLDEFGAETETFVSGRKAVIELSVTANETTESPTFGILIRDRFGNDIFGINNALLSTPAGVLRAGRRYVVRYALEMRLGANIYNLTVAAHADETHVIDNYDWINSATVFRVILSADARFSGHCKLDTQFNIDEVALT